VEAHNFEIRKHLLEYDDVMNKQREVIYSQRREVLASENLKDTVMEMVEEQGEGNNDGKRSSRPHVGTVIFPDPPRSSPFRIARCRSGTSSLEMTLLSAE
jgi:hypothetical protein